MSEEVKNNVEELLKEERKENTTMTKREKAAAWFEKNSEGILAWGTILGIAGIFAGMVYAANKADEKDKIAQREERDADRALTEKYIDAQLECAKIEADAYVRKQTATTSDIADIVKTVAKNN